MIDGSADIKQNDKTDGRGREEQGNSFLSGLLQEALDGINNFRLSVRDNMLNMAGNATGAPGLVPEMSIANRVSDSYAYGGDPGDQSYSPLSHPDFDPLGFGGDMKAQENVPPYDVPAPAGNPQDNPTGQQPPSDSQNPQGNPPEQQQPSDSQDPQGNPPGQQPPSDSPDPKGNPADQPPPPDAPAPAGDQLVKMGDRMFTVHADGSAEYSVSKGDCVWFVATDVLQARNGQKPNDAQIVAEVNAIATASGLTQNGRNPDLIYPGDKLVIPPAPSNN